MDKDNLLMIFAKNPVPGKVKTRLAASVGPEKALKVYQKLLAYTFAVAQKSAAQTVVYYSDFADPAGLPKEFLVARQHGADLGERLQNAFRDAFGQRYQKITVIGSDCPSIDENIINLAFERLNDFDLAIGPALDGGYYLLGIAKPRPELFGNIEWSTPGVFSATLEKALASGLSVFILPALNDVDEEKDLIHLDFEHPGAFQPPPLIFSVIIPTYNEAAQIGVVVRAVRERAKGEAVEIIVSDGGSDDRTLVIAGENGADALLPSRRGRAAQMNAGAALARGDLLYFLHADTLPPDDFVRRIQRAAVKGAVGGSFRLSFDYSHWFLRANCWFTRFNINAFRFGDQSLFVKKSIFYDVGGFRIDLAIMEDQEIVGRIRRRGRFVVLDDAVVTSARKYLENGVYRTQAIFYLIWTLYRLGFSQSFLRRFYQQLIRSSKITAA